MSFYMNMGNLTESSGSHGLMGRIAEEKYKKEKQKNDEADAKSKKTRDQYKRAGYEDKIPASAQKSDRQTEKELKDIVRDENNIRHKEYDGRRNMYPSRDMYYKANIHNTQAAFDIAEEYERRKKENEMTGKQKELHDRINKRAAAKHECGIFAESCFIDD